MKRITIATSLEYFDKTKDYHLPRNKIYNVHEILLGYGWRNCSRTVNTIFKI